MKLENFTKEELIIYIRTQYYKKPLLSELLVIRNELLMKKFESYMKNTPDILKDYKKWVSHDEKMNKIDEEINKNWVKIENSTGKLID